jgi:hypothetical protein
VNIYGDSLEKLYIIDACFVPHVNRFSHGMTSGKDK